MDINGLSLLHQDTNIHNINCAFGLVSKYVEAFRTIELFKI